MQPQPAPTSTPAVLVSPNAGVAPASLSNNTQSYPLMLPEDAMYGTLGSLARSTQAPLGPAYSALLTIYSGQGINLGDPKPNPRPTLYTLVTGPSTSGKTVVCERAIQALFLPEGEVETTMPVSDRGLYALLRKGLDRKESPGPIRAVSLYVDEGLAMFKKMSIQGSTLQSAFNKLWQQDRDGGSDKQGCYEVHSRLSMLTNLTVASREEFREKLPGDLRDGFISRVLIAPMPPTRWDWDHTWKPSPIQRDNREMKGWDDAYSQQTYASSEPLRPINVVDFPAARYLQIKQWEQKRTAEGIDVRRWGQLAAKVAVISASANGDMEVSPESMECALRFSEWQSMVHSIYSPSQALNPSAVVADAILDLFEAAFDVEAAGHGLKTGGQLLINEGWLSMSLLSKKHSLHRKYGALVTQAIQSLKHGGLLEELRIKQQDGTVTNTNRWRLGGMPAPTPTVDIPTAAAEPEAA